MVENTKHKRCAESFLNFSDNKSGSDIEPDNEYHITTISRLSDEDWIVVLAKTEVDSSDEKSIHETPNGNKN